MPEDADRRVPEVPNAAIRLRHAERGQVEVRLVCERHAGIAGVLDEQRLTRQLAASRGVITKKPSVRIGFVLAMPGLFDWQLGVIAWPLNSRVTPETCQSLSSCFTTGSVGERGDVVAVIGRQVVPPVVDVGPQ